MKKGACVKCGGHISFPAGAAGNKVPCPHCRALTPLLPGEEVDTRIFYKCACSLCWGNLKYPASNIGSNVTCPHCGGQTTLVAPGSQTRPASASQVTAAVAAAPVASAATPVAAAATPSAGPKTAIARPATPAGPPGVARPATMVATAAGGAKPVLKIDRPAPPAKSKLSKKALIGIVVGVVLVGAAGIGALLLSKRGGGNKAAPRAALELLEHRVFTEEGSGSVFVLGTVTNHTKSQLFNLKIVFETFDAGGIRLGTATDLANNLGAGQAWNFKAPVQEKEAKKATLIQLVGE